MSKKNIILLCGRKRTGKETIYKLFSEQLPNCKEYQFATPLKEFCINTLGLTWEQCYGDSNARESLTKHKWSDVAAHVREKYGKNTEDYLTAREVLQVTGTDAIRTILGEHVWANAASVAISQDPEIETGIVSDTRFINEIVTNRNNPDVRTIAIRIYRETNLVDTHSSESALDSWDLELNQRAILPEHRSQLYLKGYLPIYGGSNNRFWRQDRIFKKSDSNFDYLIDNNYTIEDLKSYIDYIVKQEF